MKDREELEQEALFAIPSDLYYDLADNLKETSDQELRAIIAGGQTNATN